MCGAFSATESDMNKYKDRIIHCENTGFTVFEYHGIFLFNPQVSELVE